MGIEKVNSEHHAFGALVSLIRYIGDTNGIRNPDEIRKIILQEYGIAIGEFNYDSLHTPVHFGSEENYIQFLLRWK